MPAHRNREDAAIELLQHPETFPSLPERHAANRELCLWRLPAFEPHSSWSIFRVPRSKDFFLRRLEHDPRRGLPTNVEDAHVFGCEVPISAGLVEDIVASLEGIATPMFRRPRTMGLDGVSYGLHLGGFFQGTRVNWWSHPSDEWLPLMRLHEQLVERLDPLLPASTLREHQRR